jgi:hypothetical protein
VAWVSVDTGGGIYYYDINALELRHRCGEGGGIRPVREVVDSCATHRRPRRATDDRRTLELVFPGANHDEATPGAVYRHRDREYGLADEYGEPRS